MFRQLMFSGERVPESDKIKSLIAKNRIRLLMVEITRFELVACTLRTYRSTN